MGPASEQMAGEYKLGDRVRLIYCPERGLRTPPFAQARTTKASKVAACGDAASRRVYAGEKTIGQ